MSIARYLKMKQLLSQEGIILVRKDFVYTFPNYYSLILDFEIKVFFVTNRLDPD